MPRGNTIFIGERTIPYETRARSLHLGLARLHAPAAPGETALLLTIGAATYLHMVGDIAGENLAEGIALAISEGVGFVSYEAALSAWKAGVIDAIEKAESALAARPPLLVGGAPAIGEAP